MAEFDRMRAKVLAVLASREWRAARKAEDPTMARHIPQLVRINKLGLLTFDSQAGRKDGAYAERAYCFGFVRDRASAMRLTRWVSLNTDKYASLVVGPTRATSSSRARRMSCCAAPRGTSL